MTGTLAHAVERFLLPNTCVVCGRPVPARTPDTLVCSLCISRLASVGVGCDRCQQPLPPVGPCRFCREWPDALGRVRSAVWLGREARAMIHHLKYEGYTLVADAVADTLVRALRRPRSGVLVPVPLGRRRARRRGYNQAAVMAHALGRRWRLPVAERVLARRRETRSQTALTPQERERNVAGAFAATPPPRQTRQAAPPGRQSEGARPRDAAASATSAPAVPPAGGKWRGGTVILIDDVLTTGATLAAAADALAAAGWPRVEAVTFARAVPFARRFGSV